jgi:hypothetical protein
LLTIHPAVLQVSPYPWAFSEETALFSVLHKFCEEAPFASWNDCAYVSLIFFNLSQEDLFFIGPTAPWGAQAASFFEAVPEIQ